MLNVPMGEPSGQASWECYVLILAICRWQQTGVRGRIQVIGDAAGVLAAAVGRASRAPLLSPLIQELPLVLATDHRTLDGLHIYSEANVAADGLSRMLPGAAPPVALAQAVNVGPPVPKWQIMGQQNRQVCPSPPQVGGV